MYPTDSLRESRPGGLPLHRLRRVDRHTTQIVGPIERIRAGDTALSRAARGEFGPAIKQAFLNASDEYDLVAPMFATIEHLALFESQSVNPDPAPLPEDHDILSLHMKQVGYFYKADIVGICRLPENAVYSHDAKGNPLTLDYENAIVLVAAKDYNTLYASTGKDWVSKALDFGSYQRLALITQSMAHYIRRLGYRANPQHLFCRPKPDNYQIMLPPLLLAAGIGEAGRAGIVVNPFLGLAYKAAAVLTDMPLMPDKPIDFGLQDFCSQCDICAEMCPSKAIPKGEKILYNGRVSWKLDVDRCAQFFISNPKGTGCNTCVKVCPWTRPATWNHNLVRRLVGCSHLARKLAIKADRMLTGHRREHTDKKWWFDKVSHGWTK